MRTLKANLKLDGKPCGWCQAPLTLGDDAAVCTACETAHHQSCWDTKAGCATQGCTSAPLRRLDVAPAAAPPGAPGSPFPAGVAPGAPPLARPLAPGMMNCPRCGLTISIGTPLCPACRAITSPDGLYHGPKTNAPGAVKSLVVGLIGLVVCGIILGPIAISSASKAREAMANDPSLGGEGLATAGKILGVIDIVGFLIAILIRVSSIH
ncbi:MAG TPA: RING finger protein [Kofleriaceae bacterium]|nr:RING finger protein [Kofleriaceae bacterium]